MKAILLVGLQLAVATLTSSSAVVSVPGDANIFGAGHAFAPNPGGGSGGVLPPFYMLSSNETILSFAVTGSNTLTAEFGYHGADGTRSASSQVYSYSGLSGITADSAGFLVGVFLGPEEPSEPGPTWLSFAGANDRFSTLGPRLAQLFFVGDGLVGDGSGEQQLFFVPTNATRLFLGFADANGYIGPAGQYQDNAGELAVQVQPVVLNTNQSPPLILIHPEPQALYETQIPAPFQVQVIGASPMGFQWLKDSVPVESVGSSLQLPAATMSDAGYYSVVITNAYGAVTSAPAYLNVVSSSIAISFQPRDATNVRGASAWFSVSAGSYASPLWAQWQFNGNNLPSQTNFFLTLTNIQPGNEGTYRVIISNSFQSVTSTPAKLSVVDHGPNWFGNLQSIYIEDDDAAFPYPSTIEVSGLAGAISNLTVSLFGLEHEWPDDIDILLVGPRGQSVMLMSDAGGGFSISNVNLFYAPGAGNFLPDSGQIVSGKTRPTNFGDFDTLPLPAPAGPYGNELSVFVGTDPNGTWSLYVRDDEEDGWGMINGGWRIDFDGTTPIIRGDAGELDRWHARYGSVSQTLGAVAAQGTGFTAVGLGGIVMHSTSGVLWTSNSVGYPYVLLDLAWGADSWVAVGGRDLLRSSDSINWSRCASNLPVVLNDVAFGNDTFVAVGRSDAVRVSTDSGLNWQAVTLWNGSTLEDVTFGDGKFVTVSREGHIYVSTNGVNWALAASTNSNPLYAVTFGGGMFVAVGWGGFLTSNDGTNWFRQPIPPTLTGAAFFDVIYADGRFICGGDAGYLASSIDGTNWHRRTFGATGAPRIRSLAFNGETVVAVCESGLNLIYQSDPMSPQPVGIGISPTPAKVRQGASTNFTVTAVGTSPFFYQWFREGVPVAGATNRTLVLSNAQPSVAGQYSVAISNALGSITSAPVTLTVGVPPAITVQPIGQEIVPGGTVSLSVAVTGSPPFVYRWRQPPSVFTILTSSNSQSFWTVTNFQAAHAGTYGIYVTNDYGNTVSHAAILTLASDADADGLPDSWELRYGLATNDLTDAALDLDGDGVSNLSEYRAGTDPNDSSSRLRFEVARSLGGVSLAFEAGANQTYTIEHAPEWTAGQWTRLVDFVARTNRRTEQLIVPFQEAIRAFRLVTPRQP